MKFVHAHQLGGNIDEHKGARTPDASRTVNNGRSVDVVEYTDFVALVHEVDERSQVLRLAKVRPVRILAMFDDPLDLELVEGNRKY